MSSEAWTIALNHSRATGTTKLVLLGIANHDGDGGSWPSIDTLARYGNCGSRQVKRALAQLEELGEIRRHMQQGGTSKTPPHLRPNLYEFVLQCPSTCDRTKNHRKVGEPRPNITFLHGVSPMTPGVTHDTPGVSPTTPEPTIKTSTYVDKETHVPKRARVDAAERPIAGLTRCDQYGHSIHDGACRHCGKPSKLLHSPPPPEIAAELAADRARRAAKGRRR